LLPLTILIKIIHPLKPKLKQYKQSIVKFDTDSSRVEKIIILLEKYYYYYHQNIKIVEKISSKIGEDHNIL